MLYKRGSKWWVRFTARGREIRVTSGTDRRELAEEFEQRLREAIWREKALGQEVHTWEEACERWFKEKAHKRSLVRDRQAIARLRLSGATALSDLGPEDMVGGNAREKAVLRSVLNAAVRRGWLDKAPKVEMPHAEKKEPRWITREKFIALCRELPPHAQAVARFAVSTGARSRNIFTLKWADVDTRLKIFRVSGADAKGGRAMGIPLSEEALEVIASNAGNDKTYVFTDHKGRAPIRSIKTTWGKAVKRAGLEGFRFHDLRHTWAAWHTLAGTPPLILKELGGWSSMAMVERYAALNPGHLGEWAGNARPYRSRLANNVVPKRKGVVDSDHAPRKRIPKKHRKRKPRARRKDPR